MTEQIQQQPATPEAAQARLSEASKDGVWADKLLAKEPATVSEFQSLTRTIAGDPTMEALSEGLSLISHAKLVNDFLAGPLPSGFPDLSTPAGAELAEILRGERQIPAELHRAVRAKLDSMIADAGWRARFDAKDQIAMREFQLATTLLSADVSEKAA